MSYFTHHTLHVTRHTSHVTRHTSHVTCHTSHVTRHTSHVTRHTSHVTRNTSHVLHQVIAHALSKFGCILWLDSSFELHSPLTCLFTLVEPLNPAPHVSILKPHTSHMTSIAATFNKMDCYSRYFIASHVNVTRRTSLVTRHTSLRSTAGCSPQHTLTPRLLQGKACHASHATCRNSHVTRDKSRVERYMPHVRHNTSHKASPTLLVTFHVTRHTSHVTRHTSHVTRYTSRVTHHQIWGVASSK